MDASSVQFHQTGLGHTPIGQAVMIWGGIGIEFWTDRLACAGNVITDSDMQMLADGHVFSRLFRNLANFTP
jgi:hypothetical protein